MDKTATKERTVQGKECPACSGTVHTEKQAHTVYQCHACSCLWSPSIYLGDSYGLVRPQWSTDPSADSRAIPFDFVCLGSAGITRRHGWFDPQTRLITQTG